ncbi:MAG: phosphoribosylformylglycinamidine cyclo-ligase [Firmicutes bacterium]|nr:phosphoribosylformylglycinamidine cyclo-ligase [Bacillota bacterium]
MSNKATKKTIDYKDAGVDVESGYEVVEKIKAHTKKTFDKNVLFGLGSFGGFYSIADAKNMEHPVLVSGTDGVGTKLKYAFNLDKHDTIGIDCVAMCVNDVVCQGAKPLFFLDYYASGKINPEKVEQVVAGMAKGCIDAGCALIGGETAEMPGMYKDGEYDLAGFSVGIVDKKKIINGQNIKEGDVLIGLASSGLHSNGYSLVRKLLGEDEKTLAKHDDYLRCDTKELIMTPTRIYVDTILELIRHFDIKGIAHITGGGFIENIPRIFPKGLGAQIDLTSYPVPKLFRLLQNLSGLDDEKMYNTFNMGIGMVLCVDYKIADKVIERAEKLGESAYKIGEVIKGEGVKLGKCSLRMCN